MGVESGGRENAFTAVDKISGGRLPEMFLTRLYIYIFPMFSKLSGLSESVPQAQLLVDAISISNEQKNL